MNDMVRNPYETQPDKAFWKPAIAQRHMSDVSELWDPKFPIRKTHRVSTYGSCFAQHIGRALEARGLNWFRPERAPFGLSDESARHWNYGIFSSRTGNIYTTSLLNQWVSWAAEEEQPPEEVWEKDGRFFDPFRPRIEPNGFASPEELNTSRQATIAAFRQSIEEASHFVFTLGLTEKWINAEKNFEYAMCPGTIAGRFDPEQHVFRNMSYTEVRRALKNAMQVMTKLNPKLRFAAIEHTEEDTRHMNKDFGILMLSRFLAHFKGAVQP